MKIEVNQSISTTTRYVTIPYNCDETVTKLELTKDGTNFITAINFTQSEGVFNIESWPNGTYNNCYLRATVNVQETVPTISLATINNMTVNMGEAFNILYTTNIPAVKHEFSWNGGSEYWDKTNEISVSNSVNYKYTHEAKTDVSRYNMAIRVTDANGNTSTKTFSITFTQQVAAIQLNNISDISTPKGKSFGISYSTNVTAVRHEFSWDGGNTYWDKTSEITTAGTYTYRYTHEAITDVNSYNMAIRVTDANGNTSVQTFHIYFTSSSTNKIKQEAIVSNVTSSNAYTTYSSFFNKVDVNNGIIIPGLKSNMVPQGMCKNGNYIYVSAYDYTKADYSCVYVINASTKLLEKTIWLKDNTNHVGGITTNGDYLYITCGSRIGIISLSTVNSASNDAEITPAYITIKNDTGESVRCSTCVYDSTRNYLWVGQFNENAGDHAYAYTVNGANSLIYRAKIDVPQSTQGLFFEGDAVYYSCSYGRNNASLLYACNWGGENNDFWYAPQNVIEIPPTSEGIFKEGNLMYVLFENASNYYMNSDSVPTCPVDRIYAYNLAQSSVNNPFTFTQYYRLDSGVINSTTDSNFYTTREKNLVTAGNSYTINVNPVNYVCICFYDSNDNYLGDNSNGFIENNTSDWSVGNLSTTFTVPSGASYLRVCATGNGTQITGTLTNNGSSTPSNPGSDLLDSNGAYLLDDFSGGSLDRSKWDYEWGYVRNGELQNYQDSNAVVNNGILELQGRKDSNGTWTAASIISKGHFAFMYGKIECRAKIDPTWGSFSAFWTLGDSFEFGYHNWSSPDTLGEWWAYCGEFDVMEFYSGNLTCGTFFNEKQESGRVWYNNYDFTEWHIFSMEWLTDGTLIFRIDGNELSRTSATDNRAFHIPHFILINQAIGASGGTPADSTTAITQYVDWVKYYPLSTNNVVLNSNDFYLTAMDFNDNSHNCMVRPTFNDNCINKSLTWKSSNPSLVWVHSGLCSTYAGANGTVTITATTQGGVSRNITLTVNNGTLR